MKEDKRKRLEAAGWKVGSTAEFLALDDDEAAVIELKLDLADAVRTARTRRRVTQKQLAKALRSSQSRVAKMEAGDPSVSIDLLVRTLLRLGASRRDLARHLATGKARRAARGSRRAGRIRVNCVCPGYVRTSMQERELAWEASLRNMTAAAVRAEYVSLTPLGRIEEPEDVADVVVFLASDLARFMTGEAVCVTGGAWMD